MEIKQEKLEKFIQGKQIPVCSFCGNNAWGISSKVFQLLEFDKDGLRLGGLSYPVIPVTCSHCGNTLFINAIVSNLLDPRTSNHTDKEA